MNHWIRPLAATFSLLWVAPPLVFAQATGKPSASPPAGTIERNGRRYTPFQYKKIARELPRSVMLSVPERAKATPVTFVAAVADDQKLGVKDLMFQEIQPAQTLREMAVLTVEMLDVKSLKPTGRAILVGNADVLDFVSPDRIRVTGLFVENYRGADEEQLPVVEAQLTEMLTPPAVRLAYDVRFDVRGAVIAGQVTNTGSRNFSFVRIVAEPTTLASYYSSDSVYGLKAGESKPFRINLVGAAVPRTTDVDRYFHIYVEDYRFERPHKPKGKTSSKSTAGRS